MGPCINIVFVEFLEVNERAQVIAILNPRNENLKTSPFRFDGRAFGYSFGYEGGEKVGDIDPDYKSFKINGDEIVMELGLYAMSNSQKDHTILAYLAIDILEKYEGYLDIDNYEDFAKPLPMFEHTNVYRVKGVSTFVDLKFLRKWVEHPEFYFLK